MSKIIEAGDLPVNDIVYLRKDWLGYRVVEPIINPVTKKFIWKNFLSKKGFLTLFFILLILGSSYLAFKEQITNYKKVMDNPCSFCKDCQVEINRIMNQNKIKDYEVNFSL